ncbi:ABC transporter permease [Conexibacter stalactiti]|uniref:ABC transporter permease n=1 Tax=Conexibacter stalactiti TaxID=1940611 RepID=A0ABU4HQR7_9ACTN|nr:ABC transporter permease [Conexibacter stalactiti]MDW5595057.1 ABC transporter permease [Conexibacter stalactiti]MEC5035699.1 ABC transporter permease [Conexibacter stalactiti]
MSGRDGIAFVARRLAVLLVLLVVVSFAVFSLLSIAPGEPVDVLLGTTPRSAETVQALTQKYHLDKPFLEQYWIWLRNAVQLDFGDSIQTQMPVTDELRQRLSTSLFLGLYAFAIVMVLGVGLGVIAALRRRTGADRAIVGASIVALSTPSFVGGLALIYLFGIVLELFPVYGVGSGFGDELWHMTLPAVALALTSTAAVLKTVRAAIVGVVDQDFMTFARARGLSRGRVLVAYGLRNALIPLVTMSGIVLTHLIVGAALVETTFSLPGLGELLVTSATQQDVPMLQAMAVLIAAIVVLVGLLADLVLVTVDPRIRLGRRA